MNISAINGHLTKLRVERVSQAAEKQMVSYLLYAKEPEIDLTKYLKLSLGKLEHFFAD